jgi:hypothetical protein
MKILVSFLAFAMTLALTAPSLAEEAEHEGGGHENLSEKMNAFFPPKQPDLALSKTPAKAELVAPAYFSTITGDSTQLSWKAVEGADVYHVQVATDPNFKWLVTEDFNVKATTFDVTKLEAGKHYFWRVAAVKENNAATHRKAFFATSMFATATK